jgi:NAD(P)-dependent dehydrogenase (short-subunit alcohol dehydrogenase family)
MVEANHGGKVALVDVASCAAIWGTTYMASKADLAHLSRPLAME